MEPIMFWILVIYVIGVLYTMLKITDIDPEDPIEGIKFRWSFLVLLSWFGALFLLIVDIIRKYKDKQIE